MEPVNQAVPDDSTTPGVVHDLPNLSAQESAAIMAAASTLLMETARLAEIADLGIDDPKAAKRRLFSEPLPPKPLMPLYHAVAASICMSVIPTGPMEAEVQDGFFTNIDHYLPGSVRAIVRHVPGFVPDGFVRIDGEIAPVEVKRRRFTGLGLRQLLSYMDAHGAKRGIAVAPELGCELPDNITFVAVSAGETL